MRIGEHAGRFVGATRRVARVGAALIVVSADEAAGRSAGRGCAGQRATTQGRPYDTGELVTRLCRARQFRQRGKVGRIDEVQVAVAAGVADEEDLAAVRAEARVDMGDLHVERAAMGQYGARPREPPLLEVPEEELRGAAAAVADDQAEVVAVEVGRVVREWCLYLPGVVVVDAAVEGTPAGLRP